MIKFVVDTEELWHNTYIKGRKHSNTTKTSALGRAHRATATLWNNGKTPKPLDTPSARCFLSDDYGRFQGAENDGRTFCKVYMPEFKKYFESIKTHGYTTRISTMPVDIIGGEPYLYDGNRRIACITAIGKQKEITVTKSSRTSRLKRCRDLARKALQVSYLNSEGKKVLYQPILVEGLDEYSTNSFKRSYHLAFDTLLRKCGNVEKKLVLDVGSCYGYYSFAFASAGAYVTAVEQDSLRYVLCRYLTPLYSDTDWSNPLFVLNDIRKYIEKTSLAFDFTLMINVFHHMYAANEALAWDTLNKIAMKSGYILLTMSSTSPKNIGKQEDIPKLIIGKSILDTYEDFGPIPPFGRHLFGFSR